MRILLAEDRPSLQVALKFLMEDWNIALDIVDDGLQVVEQVDCRPYDLCILDMRLPSLSGEQAARMIREKHFLPILALTADPSFLHPGISAYVDDYLEKPFEIEELHQSILELTVKSSTVTKAQGEVRLEKEPPRTPEDLQRLRQLYRRGLTALTVIGEKTGEFIVHRMIPVKIFNEFFLKGKEWVEFLDHNQARPGLCHLYKHSLAVNIAFLASDECELLRSNEAEEMKIYASFR